MRKWKVRRGLCSKWLRPKSEFSNFYILKFLTTWSAKMSVFSTDYWNVTLFFFLRIKRDLSLKNKENNEWVKPNQPGAGGMTQQFRSPTPPTHSQRTPVPFPHNHPYLQLHWFWCLLSSASTRHEHCACTYMQANTYMQTIKFKNL